MMNEAASKLPEYPVVMAMKGVGKSLGPQLMAEIGDVSRFTHKGAITAFAGVDPGVNESGSYEQKSVPLPSAVPVLFVRLCFKSWMFSSKQSHRMILSTCLWIRNEHKESLITST